MSLEETKVVGNLNRTFLIPTKTTSMENILLFDTCTLLNSNWLRGGGGSNSYAHLEGVLTVGYTA